MTNKTKAFVYILQNNSRGQIKDVNSRLFKPNTMSQIL